MNSIDPAATELPPTQPIDITALVEQISRSSNTSQSNAHRLVGANQPNAEAVDFRPANPPSTAR
jgi:hypothetical protein